MNDASGAQGSTKRPADFSRSLRSAADYTTEQHKELLELEKARIENAMRHLISSNNELREAMATEYDEEYEKALLENRDVLHEMGEKVTSLEKQIEELRQTIHPFDGTDSTSQDDGSSQDPRPESKAIEGSRATTFNDTADNLAGGHRDEEMVDSTNSGTGTEGGWL